MSLKTVVRFMQYLSLLLVLRPNSLYLKRIRRILGLYKQRDNQIETPKESRISQKEGRGCFR